jgi:hypothetical protein
MSKTYGITPIEIYIKNKSNYGYIHDIRNSALIIAHKNDVYDKNVLYIIEIASLLIKINKYDIYKILNVLGFNHKFINIIIQTVANVSLENNLQYDTFKVKDLLTEFPAIRYVQAGLNLWKKNNPQLIL